MGTCPETTYLTIIVAVCNAKPATANTRIKEEVALVPRKRSTALTIAAAKYNVRLSSKRSTLIRSNQVRSP